MLVASGQTWLSTTVQGSLVSVSGTLGQQLFGDPEANAQD